MLYLPHGCYASELKVHPKSWDQKGAKTDKDWYIHYRFYDPTILDSSGKVKPMLRIIKGMNEYKTLQDRRSVTKELLSLEMDMLQNQAYNPITKSISNVEEIEYEIYPDTPFVKAIEKAREKLSCSNNTKIDIKSTIKFIAIAAKQLRIDTSPIKDIRRRHVKKLLERCAENSQRWSSNTFNAYRKNLGILFNELIELEATEINPVRDIKKQKVIKKVRQILSPEQCQEIDAFTKQYDINFWRLIHIFYHSGARSTEIFRVRGEHVDLKKQVVKYLVLKGKSFNWVERPIKDIALPLWQDIMNNCKPKDYVFSKGLMPGPVMIRPEQASRRWRRHIQGKKENGKLGIECTWYALKHLNTTQTMNELEQQYSYNPANDMARMNGHTSTAMVVQIYDLNNNDRRLERLKKVNNRFG